MIKTNEKINEIDIMTVLFCICVVLIHLTSDPVNRLMVGSFQHTLFFIWNKAMTFVVPGFIFLSGLKLTFSYKNKEFNFITFIKRRFSKIFIPYCVWYVLYYLLFRFLGFMNVLTIKEHILSFLLGTMVSPFYFITVIFQFYILFGIFLTIFKRFNTKFAFIIFTVLGLYFLEFINFRYSDRFFMTYLIYFVFGMFAAFEFDKFKEFLKKLFVPESLITVFFAFIHIFLSYNSAYNQIAYNHHRVAECIFSMLCIVFLFNLSYKVFKLLEPFNNIVKNISDASYYIFLSHCSMIYICGDLWYRLKQTSIIGRFLFSSVIVFLTVFPLCIIYKNMLKLNINWLSKK